MISANFQRILIDLNQFFDKEIAELNSDLLKILNYVMVHYSRNVFNYKGKWDKISRSFDFNYDYVNESGSSKDILRIESQYRKYARIFKSKTDIKNSVELIEYKKFISQSMDLMVNKIIYPMERVMTRFTEMIIKYRAIYKKVEEHIEQKSSKINYELLQKFLST